MKVTSWAVALLAAYEIQAINLDTLAVLKSFATTNNRDGPTNGEMTEDEKDSLI